MKDKKLIKKLYQLYKEKKWWDNFVPLDLIKPKDAKAFSLISKK